MSGSPWALRPSRGTRPRSLPRNRPEQAEGGTGQRLLGISASGTRWIFSKNWDKPPRFETLFWNRGETGHFFRTDFVPDLVVLSRLEAQMVGSNQGNALRHLDTVVRLGAVGDLTDGQLLARFEAGGEGAACLAFEALVARHGPMVLGVCRGLLREAQDAQDAFQATWLVLIRRRPDRLAVRDSLGPWLHGVAYRTALRARAMAARRRRHETSAAQTAAQTTRNETLPENLGGIVQEEVGRLPERFRPVVVLCLLEGQTPEQAARLLGCPVGTVHSRLARGRARLRGQLLRRGVSAPAGLAAVALGTATAQAAVPDLLVQATVEAAVRVVAGSSLIIAATSAPVAALAEGVLAVMTFGKIKASLVAGVLIVCGISVGSLISARQRAELVSDHALAPAATSPPVALAIPQAAPNPRDADVVVHPGESIQDAIDKAPEGATIRIAAGVFSENLTITKPITLQGAGWTQTTIGPDRVAPLTQKQKDAFFALLDATNDPEERSRIAVAVAVREPIPTLTVKDARGVTLRGIRWRAPPITGGDGKLRREPLVLWKGGHGTLSDCAVIGPYSNGIFLSNEADLTIEKTLIAAVWNVGVSAARGTKLHLVDSDIRNCYYTAVTLGTDNATIERCRISGAAWHGIRYDGCSPTILDSQIFGNARSGIYASGKTSATIRGNVFSRNEMDAMSCWMNNTDTIEANTIVGNLREGISVINGDSKPRLLRNVIVDSPVGVWCSYASNRNGETKEQPPGDPSILDNVFFRVPQIVKVLQADRPLPPGNSATDPRVGGPADSYRLADDSPARSARAGALNPTSLASPFAIQPEETAMIPTTDTRSSEKWKRASESP